MQAPVAARRAGGARAPTRSSFPDGADTVPPVVQALTASGVDTTQASQLLGTGLWDDPQIFSNAGAARAPGTPAPDSTGFRNFSARYRARYGQDPVRTATLAYDAVALVAALVKTQGAQRFSDEVLTNTSGFTGIDGAVPLPPRRHQSARPRGDAGDADRRADHQPAAAASFSRRRGR